MPKMNGGEVIAEYLVKQKYLIFSVFVDTVMLAYLMPCII